MVGRAQIAVLRTVCHGNRWFLAETRARQRACLRLHEQGLLKRDPDNCHRYTATEQGTAWIIAHDDKQAPWPSNDPPKPQRYIGRYPRVLYR